MESSVHCHHDNTARVAVPLPDVALDVAAAAFAVCNDGSPADLRRTQCTKAVGESALRVRRLRFPPHCLRRALPLELLPPNCLPHSVCVCVRVSVCARVCASVCACTCARLEPSIVMRTEEAEWKKTFSPVSPCQPSGHLCASYLRVIAAIHFCFSAKSSGRHMSQ